jgi:hypothetical protein
MKRTAEELIALREKRERDDKAKARDERRRAASRERRGKLSDGDLLRELGLTSEELRGLVLDAKRHGTRERWARLGSGLMAKLDERERDDNELSEAAA